MAPGNTMETGTVPTLVRDRLLYRPTSWVEPLDVAAIFPGGGPLEVELGSGDGSFLVAWAQQHPERSFLGVERLLGRIRKLDRKAQRAGLENVRGLRIEASYCLEYLLPESALSALHVYFPDPWPKRRHWKNRLVCERLAAKAYAALAPGGRAHLRTDNPPYHAEMRRVFSVVPGFREEPTPEALAAVVPR